MGEVARVSEFFFFTINPNLKKFFFFGGVGRGWGGGARVSDFSQRIQI